MTDNSIYARIVKWAKSPYDDGMSIAGWFAFLGMLAILTFLWSRILREISIRV